MGVVPGVEWRTGPGKKQRCLRRLAVVAKLEERVRRVEGLHDGGVK